MVRTAQLISRVETRSDGRDRTREVTAVRLISNGYDLMRGGKDLAARVEAEVVAVGLDPTAATSTRWERARLSRDCGWVQPPKESGSAQRIVHCFEFNFNS